MGILSDLYPKRNILILSFLGSVVAYGMVGITSNLYLLFSSRIIVGIFKQTYTISSSMISASCTSSIQRAELLSHLNAARSLGFIIGPSIGSVFYQFNPSSPALLSSAIFVVNIVICFLTIPLESAGGAASSSSNTAAEEKKTHPSTSSAVVSSFHSLQLLSFLSQNHLFFPLLCPLLLLFLDSISTPSAIPSYLELRYQVEISSLGYIFSFTSLVAFFCHSLMMKPILSLTSHSIPHSVLFTLLLTLVANLFESLYATHISHYLLLYIPLTTISSSIHHPLAKSYFLHSAPAKYSGTLLGIMNLAENAVSVLAPIYSGTLYGSLGFESRGLIAAFHYSVGSIILWFLLRHQQPQLLHPATESKAENGTSADTLLVGEEDVDSGDGSDREAELETLMDLGSTGKDKVD
jgi:MFS family permease